jgi:hemerythrin superfamily protein
MLSVDRDKRGEIVTDALTLLKRDHRLIAALFLEFELAGSQQLDPVARRICKMLRVHTQIEEEIFYPFARTIAATAPLVLAAETEHIETMHCIARIEALTSDHPGFADALGTLKGRVLEHMAQEENLLFPSLEGVGATLVELGLALLERRDSLMRGFGLNDDDEIPALLQLTQPDKGSQLNRARPSSRHRGETTRRETPGKPFAGSGQRR